MCIINETLEGFSKVKCIKMCSTAWLHAGLKGGAAFQSSVVSYPAAPFTGRKQRRRTGELNEKERRHDQDPQVLWQIAATG